MTRWGTVSFSRQVLLQEVIKTNRNFRLAFVFVTITMHKLSGLRQIQSLLILKPVVQAVSIVFWKAGTVSQLNTKAEFFFKFHVSKWHCVFQCYCTHSAPVQSGICLLISLIKRFCQLCVWLLTTVYFSFMFCLLLFWTAGIRRSSKHWRRFIKVVLSVSLFTCLQSEYLKLNF